MVKDTETPIYDMLITEHVAKGNTFVATGEVTIVEARPSVQVAGKKTAAKKTARKRV